MQNEIVEDWWGQFSPDPLATLFSPTSTSFLYQDENENEESFLIYNSTTDPFNASEPIGNHSVPEMPREMWEMSTSAKTSVLIYAIIWIIALAGNCTVFVHSFRQYKKHKSRISLLILHLSVADLIVTCCLIPIEIVWRITIQWYGGKVLCKLCQFLRAFGLYLSSMVLICVSFDRFFSILFPLKFASSKKRVKVMLSCAWIASGIFSFPQAIFFSVETHPIFTNFKQCVTSTFLTTKEDARLYSIFSVSAMYFAPLLVIIFTYSAILLKIIRKSRQQQDNQASHSLTNTSCSSNQLLRRVNSASNHSTPLPCLSPMLRGESNDNSNGSNLSPSPKTPGKQGSIRRCFFSVPSNDPVSPSPYRGGSVILRGRKGKLLQVPNEHQTSISSLNSENLRKCPSQLQSEIEASPEIEVRQKCQDELAESESPLSTNRPVIAGSEYGIERSSLSRTYSTRKSQLILRVNTSATSNITRAKSRTLRLTIVIIIMFVLCWSPYVFMTLWYMFDWKGAQKVDPRLQDALFMMAVANSCVNPLVYGSFTKNCCGLKKMLGKKETKRDRPSTIKEALESKMSNN